MSDDLLEAARRWVAAGFSVLPLAWRSKRPCWPALKASGSVDATGRPVIGEYWKRQPTDAELRAWFGPARNLAVVTGLAGLVVLDFDERDAYDAWLSLAASMGRAAQRVAAASYRVYTARGVHVYLLCAEAVKSYRWACGDVKGAGSYTLVPPSVHPSGHVYRGEGSVIYGCERLVDVFPFEPDPVGGRVSTPPAPTVTDDPMESAMQATACEYGAVGRILSRVSVQDLLGLARGQRHKVRCPLHDDHVPSLVVYPDGKCQCMAGCNGGKQMSAIDLYAALHRLTLRQAIAEMDTKGAL